MQKAFFGEAEAAPGEGHHEPHEYEPISIPERIGAVMLIGVSLVIGLFPRLLLDVIVPSFDSPLFDWLRKGGAQ
jgi:NADH-quinone oxidoreductase subunit M